MSRYAEHTRVAADQSRLEIEKTLTRYGASGFGYHWERREVPIKPKGERTELREFATVVFHFKERTVRLDLPMPTEREAGSATKLQRMQRQRWRALVLVIKAKLEAVAIGISTLEHEFLADVVTKSGETVGQVLVPRLSEAVEEGRLLPPASGR
jgi:hypothetical protein